MYFGVNTSYKKEYGFKIFILSYLYFSGDIWNCNDKQIPHEEVFAQRKLLGNSYLFIYWMCI